ncbi:MAG: hypothetical protein H6737_18085 [Alphaproteobacteria bacterium]|nr:hypothetical protein [Alphaproteobacteria bacterium]
MHTIFLRTALFTLPKDGHVPIGTLIIEGEIVDRPAGGLVVIAKTFKDERGRDLAGSQVELQLPWSKIDHIWVTANP